MDISSEGVVPLRNVSDVNGLVGRREGAADSHVLQGRDICSVRVLVPDRRGVDQHFHDVTIFDMGEVPEYYVSIPELSLLSQQWPPAVLIRRGAATGVAPPSGSWGRTVPLTREANPSPRISCRVPSSVGLASPGVGS